MSYEILHDDSYCIPKRHRFTWNLIGFSPNSNAVLKLKFYLPASDCIWRYVFLSSLAIRVSEYWFFAFSQADRDSS